MSRYINAFAEFLSRNAGFIAVNATWIVGLGILFVSFDLMNALTLYLSVLAIVIGSAVLVAQRRSEIAIQLKLDTLIEVSRATNAVIGSEHKPAHELEKLLSETEDRALKGLEAEIDHNEERLDAQGERIDAVEEKVEAVGR